MGDTTVIVVVLVAKVDAGAEVRERRIARIARDARALGMSPVIYAEVLARLAERRGSTSLVRHCTNGQDPVRLDPPA